MMIALAIFLGTYLVLAVGTFPGLRIDRTGAAIIGASFMIGFNVLSFDEAIRAVDYSTLVLLFGMMIVVANLRLSGFFRLVSAWAVRHAHRPLTLLAAIVVVSGLFSAFFVNDTMCLVLTPLVLEVTAPLGRNPLPYVLAVAMASNVGSVATVTGNPQNMMIGSLSGIPYRDFAAALAPVAAIGLLLTFAVIALLFPKEFRDQRRVEMAELRVRVNRVLLWKAIAVSAGMIVFFFWGWPVPKVAIVAGALLLITRRVKPEKVYHEIDWSLLVMFAGLFIVVAGVEKTSLERDMLEFAARFRLDRVGVLSTFSALLSNIVSNVPAVLVFRPIVPRLADPSLGWLTLAMSSTLAGNLTVLGSVANLIVVQRARHDVRITFWDHCRVGIPLTVLSLVVGVAWLAWIR
ncbi:MAG: anion transporter [Acidobacteriales bacterium]|nr:MAG: anion transporter [Terriglobales bacterium]